MGRRGEADNGVKKQGNIVLRIFIRHKVLKSNREGQKRIWVTLLKVEV